MAETPLPLVCLVPSKPSSQYFSASSHLYTLVGGVPVILPSGYSKHWPNLWTIPAHALAPDFSMYQWKIYFGLVNSS